MLLAAAAAALLIRRARQRRPGEPVARGRHRGLGRAFAAQGASAGEVTPAVIQLTLTDLLALLGLPPLVLGLLRLAPPAAPRPPASASGGYSDPGRLVDAGLLVLAAFSIGWIAILRSAYTAAAVGPGLFTVDLIHPVADLAVLAARSGSRSGLAVARSCPTSRCAQPRVGDFLAVQARASGMHPGIVAAAGLAAGVLPPRRQRPDCAQPGGRSQRPGPVPAPADPPLSTVIALGAAGVASLVTLIFAIVTWGQQRPGCRSSPAPCWRWPWRPGSPGCSGRPPAISALAEQADSQFHQLADRTSDVVLLCDATGLISYASKAVAHYGYTPERLAGVTAARPGPSRRSWDRGADRRRRSARMPAGLDRARGLPGPVVRRHLAARAGDGLALCRSGPARTAAGDGPGHQRPGGAAAAGHAPDLPRRADRAAQPLLPGGAGQGPARRRPRRPGGRRAIGAERIGAIFVDLDGFTAINDSVGHGAGDLLLAQAGRRLRGLVPAHDTVARWGGDEFAVLIESATSPQEIVDIAERLAGAIAAEPFQVAGRDVSITASVGVAFADPERGLSTCCATPTWPCPGPRMPAAAGSRCSPRTCTRT